MAAGKTVSLLMIAVVLGVVGGGLAMLYLKAREADLLEALKPRSEPVAVIVAAKDLVKGDRLDTDSLSVREIPSDYLDPNAVRPADFESIEGQVLIQNLASGKPLLQSFIDQEFPLDFSDTIPQERRAMTIQVDETSTIAGLIRPGNHIDLFVNIPPTASSQGQKEDNEILPVAENVEVLATGAEAARDYEEKVRLLRAGFGARPDQGFSTLTLNVTAKQAALIALALDKGDLLALLRNREDDSGSGFIRVSTDTIERNARNLARKAAENVKERPLGEISTNENGEVVDANGNVIAGVTLNEDGTITLPDGSKVDPDEIIVNPDGSVSLKSGEKIEGVQMVSAEGDGIFDFEVDYIVGGVSEDSVATVNKLSVDEKIEAGAE